MSGHQRDLTKSQLLLDDTWIDDQAMLTRLWHEAEIYPEPLLRQEMLWEGHAPMMFGTVLRIGDGWRMYYTTESTDIAVNYTCVAESRDGFQWSRPDVGIYEYEGSKANNIVNVGRAMSVFADRRTKKHPSRPWSVEARRRRRNALGSTWQSARTGTSGLIWRKA